MKEQIEEKLSRTFDDDSFVATHFRQQVVAGMNYQIRIDLTNSGEETNQECLHVLVFVPLPYTGLSPEVKSVKVAKETDQLGHLF